MEKSINAIYVYFSRSTAHTAQLVEVQAVLSQGKVKLQRPMENRWLSLGNAVSALRKSFKSVKAILENEASEGDATAIRLTHQLRKPLYVMTLHLLADILYILNNLSLAFQRNDLNLLSIEGLLNVCQGPLT